jgi:hypothetical protein
MKKICLFLAAGCLVICANGQTRKNNSSTQPVVTAPAPTKEGVLTSFETSLAPGALSLNKVIEKGDGQSFVTSYTLSKRGDASFNNGKPLKIQLNKESFEQAFPKTSSEASAKWNSLNKYVTNRKISLTDEKGWIAAVNYYNSLQ